MHSLVFPVYYNCRPFSLRRYGRFFLWIPDQVGDDEREESVMTREESRGDEKSGPEDLKTILKFKLNRI